MMNFRLKVGFDNNRGTCLLTVEPTFSEFKSSSDVVYLVEKLVKTLDKCLGFEIKYIDHVNGNCSPPRI